MAELADAHGSGPCESNFMQVQVLLPAPIIYDAHLGVINDRCKLNTGLEPYEGESREENSSVNCF